MGTRPQRARLGALLGLACSVAVLASGCGSSDSDSTSTGTESGGSGSTAAESTNASSPDLASVEAATRTAEEPPTKIGVTTPLPSKPEPGKTFAYLQCELLQCQSIGEAIHEATDAVGWRYVQIDYKQADPSTLISAMKQALKENAVAVTFTGLPEALWSQMIPEYEKAGAAIIPEYVGAAKLQGPVIGNINSPTDTARGAKALADWFVADSEGTGKALVQNVPQYGTVNTWAEQFQGFVEESCDACEVETVNTTIAQVVGGDVPSAVVSALQRNTTLEYAFAFNGGFFTGLPAALQNAGLSDVKIGAYVGVAENVANLMAGKDGAYGGLNTDYGGWLAVDLALREAAGVKLPESQQALPFQLLTVDSATESASDFQLPDGYQDEFKKVWKVG